MLVAGAVLAEGGAGRKPPPATVNHKSTLNIPPIIKRAEI